MTTVGLPKELKPELDYQLPAGMSSYHVRVTPSNLSSIQSATQTVVSSTVNAFTMTSSNVIFEIPTQAGSNTVVHPKFSSISFRANYEVVAAGTSPMVTSAQLRSHAMSYFNRSYTQAGGVILEDIPNFDVVNDFIVQQEFNSADRDSACSYGFSYESSAASSQNNANGHKIASIDATTVAVGSNYYSYTCPLLNSIIGKGASTFFNISDVNKLQVVLTTSAVMPVTFVMGTGTGTTTFRVTLDNFQLNLVYINLGEAAKLLPKGPKYYNGVTWRSSTATLAAGITGNTTTLVGVRGSSVRALWVRATEASAPTTSACINQQFDSKALVASSLAFNIAGVSVPSNPLNTLNNASLAYLQSQQAYNSFDPYEFRCSVVPTRYFTYIPGGTLPTDAEKIYTTASNASSIDSQCMWAWGISLETVAKAGILDGQNLNSSSTFLNANLAMPSTNPITLYFLAKMDAIYIVDGNGNVSVRI